jgi:Fe-S-cluster-containing hydrogenase component 2
MPAKINLDKCTGCGSCYGVCPVRAIIIESYKAIVDAKECIECWACAKECPLEAIKMV